MELSPFHSQVIRRELPHDVHPEDLKHILEDLSAVLRAHVERNDPTRGLCTDTRCPNGPWPTLAAVRWAL